jgi:hypothetical protein
MDSHPVVAMPPDKIVNAGAARATLPPSGATVVSVDPVLEWSSARMTRLQAWAGCSIAATLLLLTKEPMALAVVCLALTGMAAASIAAPAEQGGAGFVAALPAGFTILCTWSIAWGLMGGLTGLGSWSSEIGGMAGVVGFGAVTGVVAWRRAGSVMLAGRHTTAMVGFGALLALFTWVVASQPFGWWSRVNGSGTDFMRHLRFLTDVREVGLLPPGEPGYPVALHALGAWLTTCMDLPGEAAILWRAFAPVSFLMLALILLGLMVTATRVTDRLVGASWLGAASAAMCGAAFVQTAWFDTFLKLGNIMNMLVAVALVSLIVSGLQSGIFGSTVGSVICGCALAVTANAWPLLMPVVGMAAVPWLWSFLRIGRYRAGDWVVWGVAFAVAVHGLLGQRARDNGALVAGASVSHLFRPEWWWGVAVALALLTIMAALRKGLRPWGMMSLGMLVATAGLIAWLMRISGSTWDLMLYYPAKALWTSLVVVIPLGCAGGTVLASTMWRGARGRVSPAGPVIRGSVVLVLGLSLAGVLGRSFAFPPHLTTISQGRAGLPNWSLALLDSVQPSWIDQDSTDGALVFGLVPSADAGAVIGGYVGVVDFMAMESLDLLGIDSSANSIVGPAVRSRDMARVCRYLQAHPDSLRLTGPNPKAGAQWIIDSGCPEDVVQPMRWRSLDIDPVWLERSPWEGGQWIFPTFDEVRGSASLQG